MWLEVDGHRYQHGSTKTMVFGVPYLVSYLSKFMSLQPGDVISTGTPPGVGLGQKPPVYLKPGIGCGWGSTAWACRISRSLDDRCRCPRRSCDRLVRSSAPPAVLAEPEDVIPFGFDGTAALRQRPGGVVFPHTTDEVVRVRSRRDGASRAHRDARIGYRAERRQRTDGADSLVLCLAQNERDPRSGRAQPDHPGAAGRHHAEDRRSRRRPRSLLSSRIRDRCASARLAGTSPRIPAGCAA